MIKMSHKILEGKKGIIFGALDELSIAWKTAKAIKHAGGEFILSNAPVALRMGKIDELAKNTNSQIFAADTVKQLTKSFILGTSYTFGNLNFNEDYLKKTDSVIAANNLEKIDSGNHSFKSKQTNWYLVKGTKKGYTYHQFNLTAKLSENSYFNAYSEVYGDLNIEERICESISIIENVKFLQ